MALDDSERSFLKKAVPFSAFVAGLCCFSPVVLVLLGLSTASFGSSLAGTLYGSYKWLFRSAGLLFLLLSLFWYFYRKEKVCSIDEAKKQRRKIINLVLITLILGTLAYVIWLYVVVEIIGVLLGLWSWYS